MVERHRYLVALLVEGDTAIAIDGLRFSLGSRDLERIAPHITVTPPVNVREENDRIVVDVLRDVAAKNAPIDVILGPAAKFAHRDDVVYLAVAGDIAAIDNMRKALSNSVLVAPSSRTEREFIAHVTLATHLATEHTDAAIVAMANFRVAYRFGSIALLEQDESRAGSPWTVVTSFGFERPVVVGRGGRELELTFSQNLDPEARRFYDHEWREYLRANYGPHSDHPVPFALAARLYGEVVGVATGTYSGSVWDLDRLVVAESDRGQGIGRLLLGRIERTAQELNGRRIRLITNANGQARGLYASVGYVVTAALPSWKEGKDFVVMERSVAVQ